MKILHVVHGYPPEFVGGTELYVEGLAAEQQRAGHRVLVLAGTGSRVADLQRSDLDGAAVYRIANEALFHERWDRSDSPRIERHLRQLLSDERPDLVHVHHWLRLCRNVVRAARAAGIATVLTSHDLFPSCPRVFRVRENDAFCQRPLGVESCLHCVPREPWVPDEVTAIQIERFAEDMAAELNAPHALIAPSRAHARTLSRFARVDEERIAVIPHGWRASWTEPRPPRRRRLAGAPLRIAHWGHLDAVKGVHVLLDAMSRLATPRAIELVLWGRALDPAYRSRLDDLTRGLRVERRTRFVPSDLRELDADLACFPTLAHESHSFVIDEAFALGLPVLLSDRGAPPERCGDASLLFPAGDEAALASAIQRLLDEPDLLGALRRAVPEPISLAQHASRIDAVYEGAREAMRQRDGSACPSDDRAEHWEATARFLETRGRDLENLRAAAAHETAELRRELARVRGELEGLHAAENDLRQGTLRRALVRTARGVRALWTGPLARSRK